MDDQLEVLKSVLARLRRLRIRYMVSGSIALIYYAEPRMTRDVDIVIELDQKDIERLVESFQDDFLIPESAMRTAVRDRTKFKVIEIERAVKVDLVLLKSARYRRTEFSRRRIASLAGRQDVSIVSPEDLILSKLLWAKGSDSAMQKEDVRNLLESADDLDSDHLRQWAEELSVGALLGELSDD